MDDYFEEAFREAKSYLDEGLPFWCDIFLRPKDKEFCDFIRENGYEIYYLYLFEFSEGVYSPLSYQPDELKAMANARYEKLNTKSN